MAKFRFLDDYYLMALDGTEYFSSHEVHCRGCLEKHHRNGKVTYHHQMLGAVIVCPGQKEVIPLMPEPILRQDGETKNDCERNALNRDFPFGLTWNRSKPKTHPILTSRPPCLARGDFSPLLLSFCC